MDLRSFRESIDIPLVANPTSLKELFSILGPWYSPRLFCFVVRAVALPLYLSLSLYSRCLSCQSSSFQERGPWHKQGLHCPLGGSNWSKVECHAPGIFCPYFYYLLPSFFKPTFTSNTRQAKGENNSSIDDTRNVVLLLQTDYKANHHHSRPSPKHCLGPCSRPLLRRVRIHPLPTTTR